MKKIMIAAFLMIAGQSAMAEDLSPLMDCDWNLQLNTNNEISRENLLSALKTVGQLNAKATQVLALAFGGTQIILNVRFPENYNSLRAFASKRTIAAASLSAMDDVRLTCMSDSGSTNPRGSVSN